MNNHCIKISSVRVFVLFACCATALLPHATLADTQQARFDRAVELRRSNTPDALDEAEEIFLPMAQNGNAAAMYELSVVYSYNGNRNRDMEASARWLLAAGAADYPAALNGLGFKYKNGWKPFPKDPLKAKEYYERAAAMGDSDSQVSIGVMYRLGQGIEQDPESARQWFEVALSNGAMNAASLLGQMYWSGELDQDLPRALAYFKQSEEAHPNSQTGNIRRLEREISCTGDTVVFGVPLQCVYAQDLDKAINDAGGEIVTSTSRHKSSRSVRHYESEKLLAGSTELEVFFNRDGFFVYGEYSVPDSESARSYTEVLQLVTNKYGKQSSTRKSQNLERDVIEWIQPDGVEIAVSYDEATATTFLAFIVRDLADAVQKENEEWQRKMDEQLEEENLRQQNNF